MLGQFIRYIILSCIITISLSGHAQTSVDSLRNRLAEARSLRDSVMLLYNIYDNSPASLQGRTLDDLFELAMRREDYITASDALKRSADHYADNDSMVEVIIGRAKKLPDGSDKQSTQTYITVVATPHQVSMLDEDQREDELREYIARHSLAENFDTFKRIEYLFQL